MRMLLLIGMILVLFMAPVFSLQADEAGIGWGESGNGLTAEDPAHETETGSWLDQQIDELIELFFAEE